MSQFMRLPLFTLAAAILSAGLMLFALSPSARAQTILRDAEIEQYLRDYGDPLFVAAGLDPNAVEMYIVGDPSLNAFVTAGLKMFVHTGLITAADNPNQIEGVLAHETGHLAGAHQQRGAEAYARANRPALLSMVLGAAVIAAGGSTDAGLGLMALGQNIGLREYLSYNRGQESAADAAATKYLEVAGSSGKGLVEFFDKLNNRQLITSRSIDPYLITHPLPRQRMSRLQQVVESQPDYNKEDSQEEKHRLEMIQAKINGFMDAPMNTMRRYPLRDQSMPAQYARAVAYYRSSELDDGLREIDRLIEKEPENPFFAELKGQMLFEHGKIQESITPHRRSVELAPQYALLKINLARALIATNSVEGVQEGSDILHIALQMEPDNGFGWSELARAYAFLDQEDMAQYAQAQALYAWGNYADAHRFASLAKDDLEPGSPEHLQTLDIIAASEQAGFERNGRQQRR